MTRSRRGARAVVALVVCAATLTAAAGCVDAGEGATSGGAAMSSPEPGATGQSEQPGDPGVVATSGRAAIADLPEESLATPPALRLDGGLTPPTGTWFSGLVFPEQPQPVFPSPLSYTPTDTGFSLGVPQVTTTAATIAGPAVADIAADLGTGDFQVSRYDDASVTLGFTDGQGGSAQGALTLAEGSAVAGLRADAPWSASFTARSWQPIDGASAWVGVGAVTGRSYVVATAAGGTVSGGVLSVELDEGDSLALIAVPDDAAAPQAGDAVVGAQPVTAATASYSADTETATTTLTYDTVDGGPTLLAAAPHQGDAGCADEVGTFPSVYGTLTACAGTALEWSVDAVEPTADLDLEGISGSDRDLLVTQIGVDVAALEPPPADTYFGGKALQRDALLMTLATQVGADEAAATLRERLQGELRQWADPARCAEADQRCFVFDPVQRLVVGREVSFGSEEGNDAHFHLGYFLGAAALAVRDDPDLAQDLVPVVDALAETIAAGQTTEAAPRLRVFDPYWAHSWASGWAPFADGNNQESVSEAVNAWNGLALWAQVRGDPVLEERARWLLAMEASASRDYWLDFDQDDPVYDGFDHQVASLQWGGKRDWATWFSAEPSAMLGILVLPTGPVASQYLGGDPDRIRANVAEATGGAGGSFDVMFGDHLLMYSSLAGADAAAEALDLADSLPDERLDDGNTRSYLLAFLLAQQQSGG